MILGVDPGGTTGVCVLSLSDTHTLGAWTGVELQPFEFVNWMMSDIAPWRTTDEPLVIACEAFTITANTLKLSRQHDALELIGWLRHTARLEGWEFELQAPSSAKQLVTDDVLKRLGAYVPGRGHANDATRHALLYVARHHKRVFTDMLDGGIVVDTTKNTMRTKDD